MAQRYVTDSGVLVIPGAYPDVKVQKNNSGLATSGVIFLVGEADAGPAWSDEEDLSLNFFAPTELSDVIAKYKTGKLVDAFRAAANPANDLNIPGSPSFIYCVKTNVSGKASASLTRAGLDNYGVLADKSYGLLGNMIGVTITESTSEVAPTTGSICYIPGPETGGSDGSILSVRVNGGTKANVTIAAQATPATLVTSLNAVTGLLATGGVDRGVLTGIGSGVTLAVAVSGNNVTITLGSGSWTTTPTAGDTLVIPDASTYGVTDQSVIDGASGENLGAYVVTAATSNTISATKLRDATGTGVSAPAAVSAVAIGSEAKDILCWSPVVINNMTGTSRGVIDADNVAQTVTGVATGSSLKLTLQTGATWNALPQVGDRVQIPSTAPAAWLASSANTGWYVVTAATSGTAAGASTITMTRLSNGNPASFAATAIAAAADLVCIRPSIDGIGKALELYDGAGNINVSTLFFTTAGASAASSILSTSGTPLLLTSASEKRVKTAVSRAADNVAEEIFAGGEIALTVGYVGTTASMTVTSTGRLQTTVVGGTGANLDLRLSDFRKISDLAAYIAAQSGYVAAVGSSLYGQLPTSSLDQGTWTIASDLGSKVGRVKKDAYDYFKRLTDGSGTVQLGLTDVEAAASGLPDAQATTFFSGGSKGGTTAAGLQSAIDALASLQGNFVVPLFSRDATDDIEDDETDSASTYTIDAIHAAVSSHVLEMSKLKRRRHRQGFLSHRGTFTASKTKAMNIANYRCSMTFQDVKAIDSTGAIKQFHPWMGAVMAAGMQAAGFYRAIVFKGVNCSGVVHADGTFTDQSDADLESAIENGLVAMQRPSTGGIRWNSDQTTYAADESFVFNSIQAIYASDTIALTVAQRMERAFVGQSVADVSASVALSYLQGIMADMKRLKLVAASDDAPLGYKNARIVISGNAMKVELEIKLAGAILFIPINFLVTQVTQSASQE